jgi:membrane protein YdbS with pleckstrin-like domain
MTYVSRVLQPGEAVVYETRVHPVIYWRAVLFLIIAIILAVAAWYRLDDQNIALALGAAAALVGILTLWSALRAFIRRTSTELAITDQRVIYKTGLLGRHTLEMNCSKVESVTVDQSLLGRIFGHGSVTVRGIGSAFEPIHNISDPLTFRSYLTRS